MFTSYIIKYVMHVWYLPTLPGMTLPFPQSSPSLILSLFLAASFIVETQLKGWEIVYLNTQTVNNSYYTWGDVICTMKVSVPLGIYQSFR